MIHVVFRPAGHKQESVLALCLDFLKLIREMRLSIPIIWNLAPHIIQDDGTTLLTYLSRRGAECGDMLLFPGRTGKSHHLLTINQVKRELYQINGDFRMPVWNGFFPYAIDLNRPELHAFYSSRSELLIKGREHVYRISTDTAASFELLPENANPRAVTKILKKKDTRFLLLEPDSHQDIDSWRDLLLAVQQSGQASALTPSPMALQPNSFDLADISGQLAPQTSSIDTNNQLPHTWDLIANMPGSVLLQDGRYAVRFKQGILHGVKKENKDILPPLPTMAYFCQNNIDTELQTESCFSFSGDGAHGLRERSSIQIAPEKNPCIVIRDYYFTDDCNELFFSLWWKAEELPQNSEKIVLLELPIMLLKEKCQLRYRDRHGEEHELLIKTPRNREHTQQYMLSGDYFCFQEGRQEIAPLEFRFERLLERALIEVKPAPKIKNKKDSWLVTFAPGALYMTGKKSLKKTIQERIDFRLCNGHCTG